MADKSTTARSPSPPERLKPSQTEDPDTAAAREELHNTAISDRMPSAHKADPASDKASLRIPSPDEEQHSMMREQISSPKKKRAHDEVDEPKDGSQDPNGDVSPIGANGRTDRLEPEKKRHRDISSEKKPTDSDNSALETTATTNNNTKAEPAPDKKADTGSSAFKSSGLSGFAAQPSPFLQSGKPLTSFASASGSASPFGAVSPSKAGSTASTPSAFGTSSADGSSPFGQVGGGASKPFGGSVFGGAFGSGLGGMSANKFSSFGKPGASFKSSKPAKPFGAPESDAESGDEEDGDNSNIHDATMENPEEEKQKERDEKDKYADDDEKKTKLKKVAIDDGEAGEATILQVRAKIYHLDKTSTPAAWKERGAGNLKINVPTVCVDLDESGVPLPGSFDASGLEDAESKTIRLIMRQDSTHRVILNTAVIPAMEFQEKSTNKAVCVIFTAIEGEGNAVSIQAKMNPTNARSFLNEVSKIQRELQSS
ncbi:uncharacterized protein BCR38DRAFT_353750 [Pseudomassariella vexata]|uniref:RanBD1 domain-containing protein n=1 Tax=Pseudomassariella vexata TaxID=1141098 RepID=A0A1Y2DFJ7_9PEZI|nr:uncharacterized protein BCR38DRAFT_353750 [Pseudomassariella vexata]ORY58063.1 hypothetical protein BCR38DRAFT_353750 [Pseudomassariella vexata]